MIKASIIAGQHRALPRLAQLLQSHPDVELVEYVDKELAGQRLDEVFPALKGETELIVTDTPVPENADVVFLAGEEELAKDFMSHSLPEDLRVVDMTGYFADKTDETEFVQGIAELNRKAMVRGAKYVALPSQNVLAIALGLLPLAKNLLINSPVTSAVVFQNPEAEDGSMKGGLLSETDRTQLSRALTTLQTSFGSPISGVTFSGDIDTGLTATTVITTPVELSQIKNLYNEFFDDHSFTFVVDDTPDINDVRGTNKCFIGLSKVDDKLFITTAIDTDMKGGAGNAVHAMNLLFGLLEKVGL